MYTRRRTPTGSANLSYHRAAAGNERDLSLYAVGDRLLPAGDHVLSTPPVFLHTNASAACHMPLNIAWMCDIGMAAALTHGVLCGEAL